MMVINVEIISAIAEIMFSSFSSLLQGIILCQEEL